MNETFDGRREYSVGRGRTLVRFVQHEEVFTDIDDRGGSLLVFDANTRALFSDPVQEGVVLPPGEEHKVWRSVETILSKAIESGLGRDGLFIACGGGVVCDVAAFAASIYMRGCRVILVPTTLLSMVDAAFGGKTGIDFEGLKNMVGSFHPAAELRIWIGALSSLSQRDYHSGLAEVLKHSFLERSSLRVLLDERREAVLSRDLELMRDIVSDALGVKARVVEQDFRETGVRAHLNLGHTFGHALESATGFSDFTHGEAVAWGIDKAMKTGVRLGVTEPGYANEVSSLLKSYGFELDGLPNKAEAILDAMHQDKKKRSGRVRFVLQRGWGDTFQSEVEDDLVLSVLQE